MGVMISFVAMVALGAVSIIYGRKLFEKRKQERLENPEKKTNYKETVTSFFKSDRSPEAVKSH